MAQQKLDVKRPKRPAPVCQPKEDVVIFTSYDGTVREVSDLPMPPGRATALASERATSKIWGLEQEAKECQSMFEEI